MKKSDEHNQLIPVTNQILEYDTQPAGYLTALMQGWDPRENDSTLYDMFVKLDDEDRRPNEAEWTTMQEIVMESEFYKRWPVARKESTEAAIKLMPYIHHKLSSTTIEHSSQDAAQVPKLTPSEVETFEAWFLSQF